MKFKCTRNGRQFVRHKFAAGVCGCGLHQLDHLAAMHKTRIARMKRKKAEREFKANPVIYG